MYRLTPVDDKCSMYSAGQAHPEKALIGSYRGVPAVVANGGLTLIGDWLYNDKRMPSKARISPLDTLASTSAYLGVLADTRMRHILDVDFMGVLRFFLRWRRLRGARVHQLAPAVDLGQRCIVRMSDGCLWDNRALISALHGLTLRKLMSARPLVFVLAAEERTTKWWTQWWSEEPKRDSNMPEATLFEGRCRPTIMRRNKHMRVAAFSGCTVVREGSPLRSLIATGIIDLVVIDVPVSGLNSLPFNKHRRWQRWARTIRHRLELALATLDSGYETRAIAIAISGGGARTAILGFEFLHMLREKQIKPTVLAGNSGGAWGIALSATHGAEKDIVTDMRNNLDQVMHINIVQSVILTLIRLSHANAESAETFAYILPLLQHVVFDWRKMVRQLLFGSEDVPDWTVVHRDEYTTVFPVTILAESHARRFDAY